MNRSGDFEINLDTLPVEHEMRETKSTGAFLAIFSLVWGGFPVIVLWAILARDGFSPAVLPILFFPALGLVLFLIGLNLLLTRGRIVFSPSDISYWRHSLFGHQEWVEPLSQFTGVAYRTEYRSGGKKRAAYTLHIVELQHPEKKKCIVLWRSRNPERARVVLEANSRALKLPALEKTAEGWNKREVSDLDKNVRQQTEERKLAVDFDPQQQPPRGIQLRVDGHALCISLRVAHIPLVRVVPVVVALVILPIITVWLPGALRFSLVGVALFFALVLGVSAVLRGVQQRLTVSKSGVESCWTTPIGEWKKIAIPAEKIERVDIIKHSGSNWPILIIASDTEQIDTGLGLSAEAREWLRQCVLAILTR